MNRLSGVTVCSNPPGLQDCESFGAEAGVCERGMIVAPLATARTVLISVRACNFNSLTLFLTLSLTPGARRWSLPPPLEPHLDTFSCLLSLPPSVSVADIQWRGSWTKTRTCSFKTSSVSCTTGIKHRVTLACLHDALDSSVTGLSV